MKTTVFSNILQDQDQILTGEEYSDQYGIFKHYKGLNKYWNCLEKATIAGKILHRPVILGSLMVSSEDYKSEYGYYWNPPYEFHAWVNLNIDEIFDGALPGVIEKGLITFDEFGPALTGRKPFILNGKPYNYLKYKGYVIYA